MLNEQLNDKHIKFTSDKKNRLHLEPTENDVEVTLSNNLHDMSALHENMLSGEGAISGSDVFSLPRRIHYLYIYSSVTAYVHIDDTEAPLLAVNPFQMTKSCNG